MIALLWAVYSWTQYRLWKALVFLLMGEHRGAATLTVSWFHSVFQIVVGYWVLALLTSSIVNIIVPTKVKWDPQPSFAFCTLIVRERQLLFGSYTRKCPGIAFSGCSRCYMCCRCDFVEFFANSGKLHSWLPACWCFESECLPHIIDIVYAICVVLCVTTFALGICQFVVVCVRFVLICF